MEKINNKIDHTCLGKKVNKKEIEKTINEARKYNMNACINPYYLDYINNFEGNLITVVGFPMGEQSIDSKVKECEEYMNKGVDEIDYCCNLSYLQQIKKFKKEVNKISAIPLTTKAIIETNLLNDNEIKRVTKIIDNSSIDYIKTSSGYFGEGAKVEDVKIIKDNISNNTKIKASGGIGSGQKALKMIREGADRIGASSGVEIIEDLK